MKLIVLTAFLLFNNIAKCQINLQEIKERIDSLVKSGDADKETYFYTTPYPETSSDSIKYACQTKSGKLFKISREFVRDNITVHQTFFLENDNLIYVTEFMTSYSVERNMTDSSKGVYYFLQDQIFQSKSDWKANPKLDRKKPLQELLKEFYSALDDIRKHNMSKNGS